MAKAAIETRRKPKSKSRTRKRTSTEQRFVRPLEAFAKALEECEMLAERFRSGDGSVRKKLAKAEATLEKRVEEVRTVLVKSRAAGTDAKTRRRAMNGVLKSALPRLKAQTRKEQAALRSASRAAIRDAKRAAARARAEEEKTARRIEQEEKAFRAALRKTETHAPRTPASGHHDKREPGNIIALSVGME